MQIKRALISTAILGCSMTMSLAAEQILYSYTQPESQSLYFGYSKVQVYDVAIALDNPDLKGMSITSVNVPLVPTSGSEVDGLKIFITKQLRTETVDGKPQNVADLVWDAQYPTEANADDGLYHLTFDLPEAYAIGDGPVYVGYEFNVSKINRDNRATTDPLIVAASGVAGGLWLRCSRSVQSWTDLAVDYDAVSCMSVGLIGNFDDHAVSISSVEPYMALVNEPATVKAVVVNQGNIAVSSIGYTVTVGDVAESYTLDLGSNPLPGEYGYSREVELNVPSCSTLGANTANVTITAVNGQPNSSFMKSASFSATILPFMAKSSPVYEECTGTHCPWCTRGIASMEYMRETYGDEFLVAVWHCGLNTDDPMWPGSGYPHIFSGAPTGFMNRIEAADPYFAKAQQTAASGYCFESFWQDYKNRIYPADIEVHAVKDEDNPALINITSDVHWSYIPDADAEYRMEYILIGDGLKGNDFAWMQSNNYNNAQTAAGLPLMDAFVGAGVYIVGMTFNDVALMSSRVGGIPGSVSTPTVDGHSAYTYTMNTADAVNDSNEVIAFDPERLRVLALLIKAGGTAGTIISGAQCTVVDSGAGIGSAINDSRLVTSTEYFDLAGRRITQPAQGSISIRVDRYDDGTTTITKLTNIH